MVILLLLFLTTRLFGRFDWLLILQFCWTFLWGFVLINGFDISGEEVLDEKGSLIDLVGILVMASEGGYCDFVHKIIMIVRRSILGHMYDQNLNSGALR